MYMTMVIYFMIMNFYERITKAKYNDLHNDFSKRNDNNKINKN